MRLTLVLLLTIFFSQIRSQTPSCDTTIDLTLSFCRGGSIVVNNDAYSEPGLVIYVKHATNGCDTTYRVNLIYAPIPVDMVDVPLYPNGSVVIAGQIYTTPGLVEDTIFTPGACDTLRIYNIHRVYQSVPDTCAYASHFFKIFGDPTLSEHSRAIAAAADGGFYMASAYETSPGNPNYRKPMISRYDRFGRLLWARKLLPQGVIGPGTFDNAIIGQLLEDAEGKLAGTMLANTGFNYYSGVVFRYDTQADTFLWVKIFNSGNQIIQGFTEMSGGNYLLYSNPTLTTGVARTEIWQFDRQNGAVVGGLSDYYETGTSFTVGAVKSYNGSLYVAGGVNATIFGVPGDTLQIRPMIARFDSASGASIWARRTRIYSNSTGSSGLVGFYRDFVIDQNKIVALQGTSQLYSFSDSADFFIQQYSLDGQMLQSKAYSFGSAYRAQATDIETVDDGYLIFGASIEPDFSFLMKINKAGELLWLRQITPSIGLVKSSRMYVKGADVFVSGSTDPHQADLFVLKAQQDASVNESCSSYFHDIQGFSNPAPALSDTITVKMQEFVRYGYDAKLATVAVNGIKETPLCVKCSPPPCMDVTTNTTILFCPDETVTIDGVSYGLPGVVRDTIKLTGGCDSVIVYTLDYVPSPNPLLFSFVCPPSVEVSVPAEAVSTVVQYAEPVLSSNCPCPNSDVSLWQGLASGSAFPLGLSTVAYVGSDDCGNSATCTFTVQVTAEQPCDVQTVGCMKYELLHVDTSTIGYTYHFRVTNNCSGEMDYSRFQLAGGIALNLPNESEYSAPSGRKYLVRNPHFSHVRFKTIGTGIKNGQSDVFVYTLPLSANMAFINVGTKLRSGEQFEAYMSYFGCGSNASQNREAPVLRPADNSAALNVFPNPAHDRVEIQYTSASAFQIRVYGPDGRLMHSSKSPLDGGTQRVNLVIPPHWVAGVYVVECIAEGGERAVKRVVVE